MAGPKLPSPAISSTAPRPKRRSSAAILDQYLILLASSTSIVQQPSRYNHARPLALVASSPRFTNPSPLLHVKTSVAVAQLGDKRPSRSRTFFIKLGPLIRRPRRFRCRLGGKRGLWTEFRHRGFHFIWLAAVIEGLKTAREATIAWIYQSVFAGNTNGAPRPCSRSSLF